jgi:hypothetical protein
MGISTIVYLTIGLLGIAGLILVLRSHLQSSGQKAASEVKKIHSDRNTAPLPKNPYRAISIVSGQSSCAAVKAIGTKRFLVEDGDIPQLPLSDCDVVKCACKYAHHENRRDDGGDRRAMDGSLRTQLFEHTEEKERRKKRGRRSSDWE